jgi:hypothetical protein
MTAVRVIEEVPRTERGRGCGADENNHGTETEKEEKEKKGSRRGRRLCPSPLLGFNSDSSVPILFCFSPGPLVSQKLSMMSAKWVDR